MTRREEEQRILSEAEKFLEENGLAEYLQKFLQTEEATQIVKDSFQELITRITETASNAPEELKEQGDEMKNEFLKNEKSFQKDAEANLKIRIYFSLKLLPESVLKEAMDADIIKRAFAEGKETFLKDLNELCDDMTQKHANTFLELLYQGYVPAEIPEEVADIIMMLCGGGAIIPINAVFPEFGNDFEDDTK